MSEHPSPFALDRVALGAPDGAVAAHVRACPRCAAAVDAVCGAAPAAAPGWLDAVRVAPAPATARRRRRWWWLPIPPLALAAAGAVVVLIRPDASIPPAGDVLRQKGAPAVAVYVKHGEDVVAWDGRAPVHPGDRLRLGVRGAGFAHVSVASVQPAGAPVVLYRGTLDARGETLLPLSFRVDERGDAEDLSVVLSSRPLALSMHADPPERVAAAGGWATRLHVSKENAR